jgi:hypothetical protein
MKNKPTSHLLSQPPPKKTPQTYHGTDLRFCSLRFLSKWINRGRKTAITEGKGKFQNNGTVKCGKCEQKMLQKVNIELSSLGLSNTFTRTTHHSSGGDNICI